MGESLGSSLRLVGRGCLLLLLLASYAPMQIVMPKLRLQTNQLWARWWVRALGVRLRVRGEPLSQEAIWVANHISWLDPLVMGMVRPMRFVTSDSVARHPFLGWVCRMAGCVFVSRKPWSLPQEIARLEAELPPRGGLAFFPEATSSAGDQVLPWKSSLFEIALRTQRMVQPVSVQWNHPAYAYYGDMTFASSLVTVLSHPRAEVVLSFHGPLDPQNFPHRKALAQAAEAKLHRELEWVPLC